MHINRIGRRTIICAAILVLVALIRWLAVS